jgi:hypothetical protein
MAVFGRLGARRPSWGPPRGGAGPPSLTHTMGGDAGAWDEFEQTQTSVETRGPLFPVSI